ncbi:MAG: DNA primase [Lachnospiraceae bacterium]|nr:DNA primase [Lachnospiraceae bacterium]
MNINIIKKVLKKPPNPDNKKEKYIFVNDNIKICQAIVTVGYYAMYISRADLDGYFTADSFTQYIRDIANAGTSVMDYTFVLGCFYKKANDQMAQTLKNNQISCLTGGYLLFKDKEYLGNYEKQGELESALDQYIKRFEGKDSGRVDAMQFCRLDQKGQPKGILDIAIIRFLMDSRHMFVMGQELYIYDQGCYFLDENGIAIKAEIQKLIPEQFINYRNLNGLYHLLLEQAELQRELDEVNQYPAHWVNFLNGMFDVKEMKMWKHRPEYYAINQIPHILDFSLREGLEGYGKETDSFLNNALYCPEDHITLWQYLGYCMTRDSCMQKMLFLQGDGGTGKSRIINLFQIIIGKKNFSSMSLHNLAERFYPSMLFGKILNACPDIKSEALMSVDNIKKATGEDIMIYERKGKDPMGFNSYAKLLFSANKVPLNLDEKSDAYYRRLLILEVNRKPKKKILDLDSRLGAEVQYSIWMALGGLKKLYEDGQFTESQHSRMLVEELYRDADTVKAFMDESVEDAEGSRIKNTDLYNKYKEYCQEWGRRELSLRSFYKRLKEMGYDSRKTGGFNYYDGIQFKAEDFSFDENGEGKNVFKG